MTEPFLNLLHLNSVCKQHTCTTMTKIMKSDFTQIVFCKKNFEVSGKEVFAAATTNCKEEVLFTVNYNPEITNTHVIRYNGVLYDITQVDTFEGYKEDITLYCCRRARQERGGICA